MATRNTKTAACLTAVFVLLLVPMGMAAAQQVPGGANAGPAGPVSHTGDLAALESAIHAYKNELEAEVDSDRQGVLTNLINRLDIAKAIIQASQNPAGVLPQYQNLTTDELLALLHATYDAEDFVDSRGGAGSTLANYPSSTRQIAALPAIAHEVHSVASHAPSYIDVRKTNNHYQHQYDCRDLTFVSGLAHSVLTSYTDGRAQITGSFTYPAEMDKRITERRDSTCFHFEHVETVKRHHVLASTSPGGSHVKAQVCTLMSTNPAGSDSVWCNAFGPSMLTLITTTNSYDSSLQSRTTELGSMASTILLS